MSTVRPDSTQGFPIIGCQTASTMTIGQHLVPNQLV